MRPWISALLVGAGLAAGCGSDDEQPTATKAVPLTTSAPNLAGTYERRLTHGDIERTDDRRDESLPGQDKPHPGPLQLTLDKGTLTMTDAGAGVTIRQDFSATSDGALRVGAYQTPERGSFCGPDVSQTASYRWEKSGDVLTLQADQDECADRDAILGGKWKRR